MAELLDRVNAYIGHVERIEAEQRANARSKQELQNRADEILKNSELKKEDLDIVTNAISILRIVSDNSVKESYEYITNSINTALERIFQDSERKIKMVESTLRGQYPQLEIILEVGNGVTRSIKFNSGHGLAQIISFLCVITVIVITKSRRLLVMDEILSGLSAEARRIIAEVMWQFTSIGFQFVVCEHGFIPKGSMVYRMRNVNDRGTVEATYKADAGVYLNGTDA